MKYLFCLLLVCSAWFANAQLDTSLPAYKRYPVVPGFQLLLTDSVTKFTTQDLPKKKPLVIMLFSPDCSHCQHEAQEIYANREALKQTQLLLVSTYPVAQIRTFADNYGLNKMQNVIMTKDPYYLLVSFYAVRSLPFLAYYNKKGALVETVAGSQGFARVLEAVKANQ